MDNREKTDDAVKSHWLDRLTWPTLIFAAIMFGLAPFVPEPHLAEKLKMLVAGTLSKPIDIFDLFMHATPTVLVIMKAVREAKANAAERAGEGS